MIDEPDLEENRSQEIGVLWNPRLLLGQSIAWSFVRLQMLKMLQIWILTIDVRLRMVTFTSNRILAFQ
jgi:hypothetical protein